MTTTEIKAFKTAYQLGASENPKGTTLRLKLNTGINLAKQIPIANNEESELKKLVTKFAEDNSSPVPDMRKARKDIRYRQSYMIVLHDQSINQ